MHESMFIGLAQNAALLLALVVVFDTIGLRFRKGTILLHRLALGLVIGAIGLGVMVTPMPVVPGVVFDTRSVLLGISGLFFGSFPTIIAMAMTAAYRIVQGGGGAMTGTLVIIATGSMGILWRRSCRHQMEATPWYEFYVFGVISHLVMLALMLTLPDGVRGTVLSAISLPVMALYPLATLLLGLLLSKRVLREHAANELRQSEEHLRKAEADSRRLLADTERSRMALLSVVEDRQAAEDRVRKLNADLKQAQSIAHVGSWAWDILQGTVTWSDEMYNIFSIDKSKVTGRLGDEITKVIHPDDLHLVQAANARAFADRSPVEYRIIHGDGSIHHIWAETGDVILDGSGTPVFLSGIAQDVTVFKVAEKKIQTLLDEKELLLKETHHRIKNNIGTINSLLSLQANAQVDPAAKAVLDDAAQRLQSMMVLYDKLYRSEHYGEMNVKDYLPSLIDEIAGAFPIAVPVGMDIQVDDFMLSAKALSNIGIIINELVANSMKYAFGGAERGLIHVKATIKGSRAIFIYGDDGAGLPSNIDFDHSTGFGLQLVHVLVQQIGGSINIDRNNGTTYTIELELER